MLLSPPNLPLADLAEALQKLVPIIFVVLYGIAHLVGNIQQEKRKAAAPPRPKPPLPPPNPAAGGGAANPPAGNLEETLRREVEEFLRRAQGQPPRQPQAPQRRPAQRPQRSQPAARGAAEPAEPRQTPRRLTDAPRPLTSPAPTTAEHPPAPAPLGSGVSQHVQGVTQHAQSVAQHAQTLGADVAQADERMQAHLRQRFVHPVGALPPTTTVQRQATGSPAARELRDLLARPGGVRQLIIANEILRRPEERWDN